MRNLSLALDDYLVVASMVDRLSFFFFFFCFFGEERNHERGD